MKISLHVLIVIFFVTILGCVSSGTSNLSPIEKRQVEQKILDYSFVNIYQSALVVLADQGYFILNSDIAGGLITAEKFGETRKFGFVSHNRDMFYVSLTLKNVSEDQTELRLKIQKKTFRSLGYGESLVNVEEVGTPEVSIAFYTALRTEAERRKAGFQ